MMHAFTKEVDHNFETFFNELPAGVTSAIVSLAAEKEKFKDSYRHLVSLQAWRTEVLEHLLPPDALKFFIEAHNDGLTSHFLARQGAWRVSLMSLRSCVENTLGGVFYAEHPVELAQWQTGEHRLGFTETMNYLTAHPAFNGISENESGLGLIKGEYGTLSRAVHGSSHLFRMTKAGNISLTNEHSVADLGAWTTREKIVLTGLNLILITFLRQHLQGAAHQNLRKALSLVIPVKRHGSIKQLFGVTLRTP